MSDATKCGHVYWNNQKYSECQLIALWNAAIYHNISVPIRYGKEYIEDCDKASALIGGCIDKDHVIKKLKLKPISGKLNWSWIKLNCPTEFLVFCHRGYHSVLSVDIDIHNKRVLLANYAKKRLHWMSVDELIKIHNNSAKPIKWDKC